MKADLKEGAGAGPHARCNFRIFPMHAAASESLSFLGRVIAFDCQGMGETHPARLRVRAGRYSQAKC